MRRRNRPSLALDLFDDGMARTRARIHDRLLAVDFAVLKAPNQPDSLAVTRVLVRAADFNERARTLVADALRDSLGADPVTRQMTEQVPSAHRDRDAPRPRRLTRRPKHRTNPRNGYRHRGFDTRAGTLDVAIPKLRSGS